MWYTFIFSFYLSPHNVLQLFSTFKMWNSFFVCFAVFIIAVDISVMSRYIAHFIETNICNMQYCNQRHINAQAHLPIVFDCRDVIKICGQLWSQEQPSMKFWASFPRIYGIQQAKQIRKLTIPISLTCWNRKIQEKLAHKFHVKLFLCFFQKKLPTSR